jgi:hypothetical protein
LRGANCGSRMALASEAILQTRRFRIPLQADVSARKLS